MSECELIRPPRERRKVEELFRREGMYAVEEAYVVPADAPWFALALSDAVLEVQKEDEERMMVHGKATVHNVSLVQLLEDHERLDMIINMGEGFVFYLEDPIIQAGKVFSPAVSSTMRFIPRESFDHWSDEAYTRFKASLSSSR